MSQILLKHQVFNLKLEIIKDSVFMVAQIYKVNAGYGYTPIDYFILHNGEFKIDGFKSNIINLFIDSGLFECSYDSKLNIQTFKFNSETMLKMV